MGKKKQSFLDALVGSFKSNKKNDIEEFYNEEGNFEEFTPIKGSKKYKDQIIEKNAITENDESNSETNYFEEKSAKTTKLEKETQTNNDFYSEESSFEGQSDNGFNEEENNDTLLGKIKNNLKIVILIAILIILLIIVLIVQSCTLKPGELTDINVNIPSIVYVDEQTEISATAIGKRNLEQTKYQFKVTNESIIDLEAKGQLTGRKVKNKLFPLATGKISVIVSSKLDKRVLKDVVTDVTICKKLKENSLATDDGIIIEMESENNRINLDVGSEDECFEVIDFKIDDTSIISIDEYGYFTPKKEGTTKITITDGTTTIVDDIHVKVKEDLTRVMGIKLNIDKTTIKVGKTLQINATITPDTATNKNINWTSNNNGVVSVTNRGLIKGIGEGVAVITAETSDNKQQAVVIVTVEKDAAIEYIDRDAPKLTSVNIISNNDIKTEAWVGNDVTLTVTSNEVLETNPAMYINNNAVTVTCNQNKLSCSGIISITDNMPTGKVTIKIINYKDKSGNIGKEVTTTTDGSSVTIYKLSKWSDLTEDVCDITKTDICQQETGYYKRLTRTSSQVESSCYIREGCNGATGLCNGAAPPSCAGGYTDVGWRTAGPACCTYRTVYSNWVFKSYEKNCTPSDLVACNAVTLYKTRTKS